MFLRVRSTASGVTEIESMPQRTPEILSSLEHLEQHPLGLLIETQQADELAEHIVFGGAGNVELDCVFAEELAQFHPSSVKKGCREIVNLRSYPGLERVSNADIAWTSALS
jgi:hypothetical protein